MLKNLENIIDSIKTFDSTLAVVIVVGLGFIIILKNVEKTVYS